MSKNKNTCIASKRARYVDDANLWNVMTRSNARRQSTCVERPVALHVVQLLNSNCLVFVSAFHVNQALYITVTVQKSTKAVYVRIERVSRGISSFFQILFLTIRSGMLVVIVFVRGRWERSFRTGRHNIHTRIIPYGHAIFRVRWKSIRANGIRRRRRNAGSCFVINHQTSHNALGQRLCRL